MPCEKAHTHACDVDVVPIEHQERVCDETDNIPWDAQRELSKRHDEVYQMLKKIFHQGRAMPCALFSNASTRRV